MFRNPMDADARQNRQRAQYWPAAALSAQALTTLIVFGAVSVSAFAGTQVRLHLQGDIAPECTIGGQSGGSSATLALPLELGDISRPGSKEYAFLLGCNAPFSYRLEAQYGAFTNTGVEQAQDGFTAAILYDVKISIPTDGGPIQDWCASASLRSGRVTCSFTPSADNTALNSLARLTFTWRPNGLPIAGEYSDRIVFQISALL
jgi:hypothetical protein